MGKQTSAAQRTSRLQTPDKAPPELSDEEIRRHIAEAAYYRAESRGFASGGEMQDWLQAEAEIAKRLGNSAELN